MLILKSKTRFQNASKKTGMGAAKLWHKVATIVLQTREINDTIQPKGFQLFGCVTKAGFEWGGKNLPNGVSL